MKIEKRLRAKPLEKDISRDIMEALNRLPGVTVWRNANTHVEQWDPKTGAVAHYRAGLGDGSPDLFGGVTVSMIGPKGPVIVARLFALEVKRPGETRKPNQIEFAAQIHFIRGFTCEVTSVAEALAAVERCRNGEIQ